MSQALIIVLAAALVAVAAWRTRYWLPFAGRQSSRNSPDRAPFSIDRHMGSVRVKGSSAVLRSGMPKTELLDSDLYRHTTSAKHFALRDGQGHSFLISFRDPAFENVHLWLNFENDRLGRIDFGWGPKVSAAEWTEERVQADVARYQNFLTRELGSVNSFPCEFSWGRVYAGKDPKAGAPAVGIRYKGFEFRAP